MNILKKIWEYLKIFANTWAPVLLLILMFVFLTQISQKNTPEYKDFKDGIQNHLVWSIKGECFFVKPQTEQTVLLVRVVDCDRK
jgi:hypothetical protein